MERILKWVALDPAGMEPRRAKDGDAGYDLFVSKQTRIDPGETKNVPTSIAVEMPSQIWGMLVPRSSTLRTRGLHVMTGIIDNGYRGELFTTVHNLTEETVILEPGERVVQLILMPLVAVPVQQVGELSSTDRGDGGFGSTGR